MSASPWNLEQLSIVPETFPAPGFDVPGLRALFFAGPPHKGKPTRSFAFIGIPDHAPGERLPAMVLVHGGGGTAFPEWVKLWNSRGYAAIAMDTVGGVPNLEAIGTRPEQHEHGGPFGWGGWEQTDDAEEDQWSFHAISNVLLAHTLLRSLPEVDEDRIGITGISWGGYLTCIAAGNDPRFKFAAPVYGCGFLGEKSTWLPMFADLGPEKAARWLELWDPSQHIGRAEMPFLYVNGTNDFAYPLSSAAKTYALLPEEKVTYCVRIGMAHGHRGPGENPAEIHAMAENILKGAPPLARVHSVQLEGDTITAGYEPTRPIVHAELCYTTDPEPWEKREWHTAEVEHDAENHVVTGKLPAGTVEFFVSLRDSGECVTTSAPVILGSG